MAGKDLNLHGSGVVAQRVAMQRHHLLYRIEKGDLPGPTYQISGRRLFTDEDVERIAAALEKRPELRRRSGNHQREPKN